VTARTPVHVLGAGAFGTALAAALLRDGRTPSLHARNPAAHPAAQPAVQPLTAPLTSGAAVLLAVPAPATAALLDTVRLPPDAAAVICAKGISGPGSLLQSEIVAACHPGPVAVLTGPSFAAEIRRGLPTALTLACADPDIGRRLQAALSTPALRLYLTTDVTGAQLGGALKNVVAIACGIATGARLGESARAALMTRGFAEMVRLGTAMGGRADTFAGLSGLGDLALTCASPMSRNFAAGLALGQGGGPASGVTVEGTGTARAVLGLAARHGVEMPIAAAVAAVLDGSTGVAEAMAGLLARPQRSEG
jgi:glycerol-3-phosphate dehydrogenase (NAD(P)+)